MHPEDLIRQALNANAEFWTDVEITINDGELRMNLPINALTDEVLTALEEDEEAVAALARDHGLIGQHDCPECGAQGICATA